MVATRWRGGPIGKALDFWDGWTEDFYYPLHDVARRLREPKPDGRIWLDVDLTGDD